MKLKKYDDNFVLREAMHLIQSKGAYEEVSQKFDMPLSTVHWHLNRYLMDAHPLIWCQVRAVTNRHKGHRIR